jgi:hypothetical protein
MLKAEPDRDGGFPLPTLLLSWRSEVTRRPWLVGETPAVTAKRTVPRFAERVSAVPPTRGDPHREDVLAIGKKS